MIGRLVGILAEKQPPYLLIDVNGVGYEVQAPMTSIYQLPSLGESVTLYTHFSVSENAQQLFAFKDTTDRQLFRLLIKVSGIGPKMALAILSGMETPSFVSAIKSGNSGTLVKVPGVGRKTAERLVVEMQDRLRDWQDDGESLPGQSNTVPAGGANSDMVGEAESALIALGYKPTEASKVIHQILSQQTPARSEELIRLALRAMLPV